MSSNKIRIIALAAALVSTVVSPKAFAQLMMMTHAGLGTGFVPGNCGTLDLSSSICSVNLAATATGFF